MTTDRTDTVYARQACPVPPQWALLQRALFEATDAALPVFADRYLRGDGSIRRSDAFAADVRFDAFYESLYNWPTFHALGGSELALATADRAWHGITAQLHRYGLLHGEFPTAQDWFHLAEGNLLTYGLISGADPHDPEWTARSERFADLYLGSPNYDPALKQMLAPLTGGDGPRPYLSSDSPNPYQPGITPTYSNRPVMRAYGLPYDDVPGITAYDDLADKELARRMGAVMAERMSDGDVVQNLAATSLVTLAFLRSGRERYRDWVLDYVGRWWDAAAKNGGLIPDNVGPSGVVGERMDGRWWGGLYGWTWPHGLPNILAATIGAAQNAQLLTGDAGYFEVPRAILERAYELGSVQSLEGLETSAPGKWPVEIGADADKVFVIPHRYRASGWFDHHPPTAMYPMALWAHTQEARDWQRLEWLAGHAGYDWARVRTFHNKVENGHEGAWQRYLAGANPAFPEQILQSALALVRQRLDLIRGDRADLDNDRIDKHYQTGYNPVMTEALMLTTTGAPPAIYNAGIPHGRVWYADPARGRAGLPRELAALVTGLTADAVALRLVNLDPVNPHDVLVGAGRYGEHEFTSVEIDQPTDDSGYPGSTSYGGAHLLPEQRVTTRRHQTSGSVVRIELGPGTQARLRLGMRRFAHRPALRGPTLLR